MCRRAMMRRAAMEIPLPRARPSRRPLPPLLPVLATAVLLAGLVAQFALPVRTPLPEVAPSTARAVPRSIMPVAAVPASPLLVQRTLFAPSRRFDPASAAAGSANGAPTVVDPFAGATLAGIARDRAFAVAVLRLAGGTTVSVRPGGRVGDWRLIRVGAASASFARAGVVRTLIVGETSKVQPAVQQSPPEVTQS